MYSIQPYDFITTQQVCSFKIDRIELTLFKQAILTIMLLNQSGGPVDIKVLQMNGNDYEQWNNDDNYVVEFVMNKLGFVKPVPQPPAEEPVTETVEEPVTETVEEPVQEPVTETAEEPVTETVEEPVTETAEEPVTETAEEPVTEPVEEPVTEPVQEPVTETAEEPVTETAEEPVQEPVQEPTP